MRLYNITVWNGEYNEDWFSDWFLIGANNIEKAEITAKDLYKQKDLENGIVIDSCETFTTDNGYNIKIIED